MCALEACKALDRHGKFCFSIYRKTLCRKILKIPMKFQKMAPRRWNRTTASLPAYRFEACTPDHRRSSGQWESTFRSLYTQM